MMKIFIRILFSHFEIYGDVTIMLEKYRAL